MQLEQAIQNARLAAQGKLGVVRLGFVSTAGTYLIPNLINKYRTLNPLVEFSLRNILTADQGPMLEEGALDNLPPLDELVASKSILRLLLSVKSRSDSGILNRSSIWKNVSVKSWRSWMARTSWSFARRCSICSRRGVLLTRRNKRLSKPPPTGEQRIASRLKARRLKRPVMCDMVPGWLRTRNSRMMEDMMMIVFIQCLLWDGVRRYAVAK